MSFHKTQYFFILIINIIFFENIHGEYVIIMNKECKSKMSLEQNDNNFLMEIMRGKIPLKIENIYLNESDPNLISKINGNINCPYIIRDSNDITNETIGIYLGAGINLLNYDYADIANSIRRVKMQNIHEVIGYLKIIRDVQNSTIINESILDKYPTPVKYIDLFNLVMINYTMNKLMEETNNYQKYNSIYLNTLVSLYMQQIIVKDEFLHYLEMSISDASYSVEHLMEFFPNTRLIQSKLISFYDSNYKYNPNHIFFIIEKNIFTQIELDNINSAIKFMYDKLINNNRISILIKNGDNYNYLINYKKDRDNLDNLLKTDNKSDIFVNITEIYNNINKKFKENKKDYFENKIAILFLNYETNISLEHNELIRDYLKQYNIQTIPVINIANKNETEISKDIFDYNIFYNFTEKINTQYILTAINNMHAFIDMDMNNTAQIKLENIKLNDIDTPIYFQINTGENNNELEYYEISLEINKSSGYNIFISSSNPYPNIRNNLNHFLKYANCSCPKINIKSLDIKEKTFYIGIEGNVLFNLIINKKIFDGDISKLNLTEGEYDYIDYNVGLGKEIKKVLIGTETFGEDRDLKSKIFKGETEQNMMKYFTRGIDVDNTDTSTSFLNYELFIYLYGDALLNRIYKDKNNNYYCGINIYLKTFSPFILKKEEFSRLTINKLYPFLEASPILNGTAPSVIFDDAEIKKIYNITFKLYISELSQKIGKSSIYIPFKDQTPTMKFILFCLYFYHKTEASILRVINYLSMRNPEYSEALHLLKDNYGEKNFIMNLIKQLEQEDKSEKILTSIIMGKSLILSNIGTNFISEYYNIMSKSMTKTSISIYDTLNNKINNLIPFSSNNNQKVEEFNETLIDQRDNYNDKQIMDFYSIIKFGYEQFKNYDKGIKKKLIVICDENLKDGEYIINNELNIDKTNFNKIDLYNNQIELILVTSKNYEKGQIHELFQISNEVNNTNYTIYSIYENYFHVSNLNNTEKYMTDLNRLIKGSSIKIKLGQRLINDYYKEKNSYFKIDCSKYQDDVIVIETNVSNYNFYASLKNPFPYYSDSNLIQINNDAAVITKCEGGFAYLCLQPKLDIRKEKIEVFSCESYQPEKKNCRNNENKKIWILFGTLVLAFVFSFTIYKCKYNFSTKLNTKNKKRLNVFD